jgi:carboxyl-terminal processing protease
LKQANNEEYDKAIKEPYKNLLEKLKAKTNEELAVNKEEIKSHLKSEIVKRYYYKKGEYINKVFNDKHIAKAVATLKDDKKYARILK